MGEARGGGVGEAYQLSSAAPEQLVHAAELADFGHHGRHLAAKLLLNLVHFDGGVIQHIMQQRSNDGGFSPAPHSAPSRDTLYIFHVTAQATELEPVTKALHPQGVVQTNCRS